MEVGMRRTSNWRVTPRRVACLVGALIVIGSCPALSWDGNRNGFVLGFGAGPGLLSGDSATRADLFTELKLGYAPSARWIVHYDGLQVWDITKGGTLLAPSVALTFLLRPQAPSAYGTIGAGLIAGVPGTEESGDDLGTSFHATAGWEFAPHFGIELGYLQGSLDATLHHVSVSVVAFGY
jgi:hypothetical protein